MLSRNSLHVADRVLRELRRDYRTILLFTASPTFVMVLCAGMMADHPAAFNRTGLLVLGLFPTAPAFLFTAFALQRDRYRGSLEYLLTTPVTRLDILVGYVLAFTVPALAQVGLTLSVTYGLLGLETRGSLWVVALMALMSCVLGVVMGMFSVNLAKNELHLTKILPAVALPHLMVAGLFRPYDEMVGWMQVIATFAPWRYATGAIAELEKNTSLTSTFWLNLGVTTGIVLLLSAASTLTVLRRRKA